MPYIDAAADQTDLAFNNNSEDINGSQSLAGVSNAVAIGFPQFCNNTKHHGRIGQYCCPYLLLHRHQLRSQPVGLMKMCALNGQSQLVHIRPGPERYTKGLCHQDGPPSQYF